MHFDGGKSQTRFLEQNILNLSYAQFDGVGEFDIPEMLPTHIDNLDSIPIQGFNFALKETHPEKLGFIFSCMIINLNVYGNIQIDMLMC